MSPWFVGGVPMSKLNRERWHGCRISAVYAVYLVALLSLLSFSARADMQSPSQLAQQLVTEFLQLPTENPGSVRAFAEKSVLPNINIEHMTIALCGRSQWEQWSQQERSALLKAVHHTLVRYILEASQAFDQQTIQVINEDIVKPSERVVRAVVRTQYLPDVDIDLYVRSDAAGRWKAHDFAVEGISYVKLKRAQYKSVLAEGGLPALLTYLNGKNETYFSENVAGVSP